MEKERPYWLPEHPWVSQLLEAPSLKIKAGDAGTQGPSLLPKVRWQHC